MGKVGGAANAPATVYPTTVVATTVGGAEEVFVQLTATASSSSSAARSSVERDMVWGVGGVGLEIGTVSGRPRPADAAICLSLLDASLIPGKHMHIHAYSMTPTLLVQHVVLQLIAPHCCG